MSLGKNMQIYAKIVKFMYVQYTKPTTCYAILLLAKSHHKCENPSWILLQSKNCSICCLFCVIGHVFAENKLALRHFTAIFLKSCMSSLLFSKLRFRIKWYMYDKLSDHHKKSSRYSSKNHRAGNSLIGFPSESLVFCPKMSEWAIRSKKLAIHSFAHFWLAIWAICSQSLISSERPAQIAHGRSFLVSNLSDSLT